MALVCGICRKSLSSIEEEHIVHTPCGHVFHRPCILQFLKTFQDKNGKSYCFNCKMRCDPSNLTPVYPIVRGSAADAATGDCQRQQSPSTGTQNLKNDGNHLFPWKSYLVAYTIFIFVLIAGRKYLDQNISKFEMGDDELYEAGTYLDDIWAILFAFAGIIAFIFDQYFE